MTSRESLRDSAAFRLLRALTRAHQAAVAVSDRWIERYELAPGEFDIVMTLGNTPGLRMCDLASRTLTTPPNITRLVKSLEDRGLVERQRNPRSEREVIAKLTAEGDALFQQAYPATYAHWRDRLADVFDADEQRQLIDLLDRLAAPRDPTP